MSSERDNRIKDAADRIVELGEEVEAPGHVALDASSLVQARAVMREWIDNMQGIVVNPALGRVTVIHEGGYASSIASADLAFLLSAAGVTRAL